MAKRKNKPLIDSDSSSDCSDLDSVSNNPVQTKLLIRFIPDIPIFFMCFHPMAVIVRAYLFNAQYGYGKSYNYKKIRVRKKCNFNN